MTDLTAQLVVTANAEGVETGIGKAKKSLASLGATAAQAGEQASTGIDKIGEGGARAAQKVERSTTSLIGSIQRTTAALEAGGRSSAEYYRVLAQQRGINPEALKPFLDQLDAVQAKARAATIAVKDLPATLSTSLGATGFSKSLAGVSTSLGASGFGEQKQAIAEVAAAATQAVPAVAAAAAANTRYVMSAKASAAALRGLPAQITDIVVGLQAGQAPLTVLLQQGGQLKDLFGGIGPAARALGGYVLGLVNPFTIAAAAIAAIGYAYSQGSKESAEFNKALVLTGNAAGTTVGQLSAMATAISNIAGTKGNAADALTQLAATGQVAGKGLQDAATAAVLFERATGAAISETVKNFAELGKAPLQASLKLNESLKYLTLTTYGQIKALEEQGRTAEAAAAAQNAYSDALLDRGGQIEERLGSIESAWRGIKDVAKGAWDAMLNVGRESTLEEQLSRVEGQIAKAHAPFDPSAFGGGNAEARAQLQDNIKLAASLNTRIAGERSLAAAAKASADQVAARIRFDKDGEQFTTNAVKAEREIAKARNEGAAAGASQVEIEKRIADIRAKFADKGGKKPASPLAIDKAELTADIAAITAAQAQLQGIYTNSERVLEAVRAAGGLSDREYFESKREFIRLEEAAQEDALQKQIARYQQEKLSGKEAIDNQRKIADAQSKLAEISATAATQITITTIQEAAAIKGLELAYLSARQAAQDYYDTTQAQQNRALAGIGQGNKQRGFDIGVSQIEDRYASQRRDLDNQRALLELGGKFTEDARKQYDDRLSIINEFQAKSIASFAAYYGKLDEASRSWSLGASEALTNYANESQNAFAQTEEAVTRAFRGMEDALVEFTLTGKLDFKSLANSIIADIARIAIRQGITGPLAESLNGAIKGGAASGGGIGDYLASLLASFGGGRAGGGPVEAGKLYRVNEQRPELLNVGGSQFLMMGNRGGSVAPNAGGGAAPGRTQHISITIAPPAGMTPQTSAQFARDAARQIGMATARGTA